MYGQWDHEAGHAVRDSETRAAFVRMLMDFDKAGLLAETGYRVIAGTCPMCRFTADLASENTLGRSYPSYNGDRILAAGKGWTPPWTPLGPADAAGAWRASEGLKSFRTDGTAPGDV